MGYRLYLDVDSINGQGAPVTSFYGSLDTLSDLRSLDRPTISNATVTVARYDTNGTGGGGIFRWDPTDTRADDDGVIVRPHDVASNIAGRWNRVFDGAINVQWYGARGTSSAFFPFNDGAKIQAAITASLAIKGLVDVYIPMGTYYCKDQILIPHSNGTRSCPVRIRGQGSGSNVSSTWSGGAAGHRNGTVLRGAQEMAGATLGTTALMTINGVLDQNPTQSVLIEGLTIMRGDTGDSAGGQCFFYQYTDPGSGLGGRFKLGHIRDCSFFAGNSTSTAVRLEGVYDSVVENCLFGGGAVGLYAYLGSRLIVRNCAGYDKTTDLCTFKFEQCGNSVFTMLRPEGGAAGAKVVHIKDSQHVILDHLEVDGSAQDYTLYIENCHVVRCRNIICGATAGKTGIDINTGSSNVVIDGGYCSGGGSTMTAIHTDSTARHVRIDGFRILDGTSAGSGSVVLDAGGIDVYVRIIEHTASPYLAYEYATGVVDTPTIITSTMLYRDIGNLACRGQFALGTSINGIEQGQWDGHEVSIYCTGAITFAHNYASTLAARGKPMLLSGHANWSATQYSTITLIYRASATTAVGTGAWVEKSRTTI